MSSGDDKMLEDYLAGDSELSRRYHAESARDAPPGEIDDRLRAAARGRVRGRPRRRGLLPATWARPLAAAAVIVLAVGVVLQIVRDNAHTVFDETESTLTKESRDKAGEAPSSGREGEAAAPEPGERPQQRFEYQRAPPAEAAPGRAPNTQAPLKRTPRQQSSGAAPDSTPGDESGPRGPGSVDDPRAWADHIRHLVEQGQLEAARNYMMRYYDRFPGRPLPRDLLDMLERGAAAHPE